MDCEPLFVTENRIVVFLGPTCTVEEATQHVPAATYLEPAARGSIYRIVNDGYSTIVLIDGFFYTKLSVWHKELLFALDCGITVIGAASMGALRAAELPGLTGVGTVFEWYRDGVIDGDDEVALLHGPQESGFPALTVPIVNLRWNLARAQVAGVMDRHSAALALERASELCFSERTYPRIFEPLRGRVDVEALLAWLRANGEDRKKMDAFEALRLAATIAPATVKRPTLQPFEHLHMSVGIEYFRSERLRSTLAAGPDGSVPLSTYASWLSPADNAHRGLALARTFQRLVTGWGRELRLRPPQLPAADASSLPWNGAVIGFEHRRNSGLTVIDIERERRDEMFQHELQAHLCDGTPIGVLDAIGDRLTTELAGVDGAPLEWRRMIDLTPELVYTLWVLGRRKHIGPVETDTTDPPTSEGLRSDAEDAWRFAMWTVERGPKCFGYAIDPSAEILMAYRYLDCLDRIPSPNSA